MNINPRRMTLLAPTRGNTSDEAVRIDVHADLCRWYGLADLIWEIHVEAPGAYRAEIAYSSSIDAAPYRLLLDSKTVGDGSLSRTSGFFSAQTPSLNYELLRHPEILRLAAGDHTLSVRIDAGGDPPSVSVCDIRLHPESTEGARAEEQQRAIEARSDLAWFRNCGYGLMFHWTSDSKPKNGPRKPYPRAVADFDVEGFADMVRTTGAAYVMLTANHAEPSFPAPLEYWESLYPGWTTERDLVAELIEALDTRGIKLFLYLNPFSAYIASGRLRNLDGSRTYSNERQIHPDCSVDFLDTTCQLLEDIGTRYGEKLAGYWFDSWYQPFNQFGSFPMEPVYSAAKSGNANRFTCFNWWIRPVGTPWGEYWAAEVGGPGVLPEDGGEDQGMVSGAGKGLNGHALLIMDDPWVHGKLNTDVVAPRHTKNRLIDFVSDCSQKNAPVTINLGIYQDGGIGDGAADVMESIRQAFR